MLLLCDGSRTCSSQRASLQKTLAVRRIPALDSPALPSSRCCSCCSMEPTNRKQWAQTSASALAGKPSHTLISMPVATQECREGVHPIWLWKSSSLVGGVLRCHQGRLTKDDLTSHKALHAQAPQHLKVQLHGSRLTHVSASGLCMSGACPWLEYDLPCWQSGACPCYHRRRTGCSVPQAGAANTGLAAFSNVLCSARPRNEMLRWRHVHACMHQDKHSSGQAL